MRGFAVAALAAIITGIVVNALILQSERHPAPFFTASLHTKAVAPQPSPEGVTPSPVAVSSAGVPASPPVRPSDLAVREPRTFSRATDPIAEILRGGETREAQRLETTAENALAKLGYPIKAGDASKANSAAALRDFEKARGLPISTELTPRLVKLLSAAANSPPSH